MMSRPNRCGEVRKRPVVGDHLQPLVGRHRREPLLLGRVEAAAESRRGAARNAPDRSGAAARTCPHTSFTDALAVLRIEPVVRVAERDARRPSRASPARLGISRISAFSRCVQIALGAGLDLRVAALLDERRQPADLQLAADDDEDVRLLQLQDEARLRLDDSADPGSRAPSPRSWRDRRRPRGRSPPRSSVAVMTFNLPCAEAVPANNNSARKATTSFAFMTLFSGGRERPALRPTTDDRRPMTNDQRPTTND